MKELSDAMALIRRWHMRHNLVVPAVQFVYPTSQPLYEADATLKYDWDQLMMPSSWHYRDLHYEIQGVKLSFDYQRAMFNV